MNSALKPSAAPGKSIVLAFSSECVVLLADGVEKVSINASGVHRGTSPIGKRPSPLGPLKDPRHIMIVTNMSGQQLKALPFRPSGKETFAVTALFSMQLP